MLKEDSTGLKCLCCWRKAWLRERHSQNKRKASATVNVKNVNKVVLLLIFFLQSNALTEGQEKGAVCMSVSLCMIGNDKMLGEVRTGRNANYQMCFSSTVK